MIAKAVNHVSLCVDDLEAALGFYCGVLGLRSEERPEMGFPGAWLSAGDTQLHLIVPPEGMDVGHTAEKLNPMAGHLAFEVEDHEAAKRRLEEAGLEVLDIGSLRGQMWVRDPSGNIIELITPGARA